MIFTNPNRVVNYPSPVLREVLNYALRLLDRFPFAAFTNPLRIYHATFQVFGFTSQEKNFRPPFLLEYRSQEVRPDGSFLPQSRISLSPEFGWSGLMQCITSDDLVTLLLVLSQVKPDGGFVMTPEVLAPMLGVSRSVAQRRLKHLTTLLWHGQPLVNELKTENGLRLFIPSAHLFEVESNAIIPIPQGLQAHDVLPIDAGALAPSRREESVARSRELYARPRAEVEREIEQFLTGSKHGHKQSVFEADLPIPNSDPKSESMEAIESPHLPARLQADGNQPTYEGRRWLTLKKRLYEVGLSHTQAKGLLDSYPFERIERQLDWLSHRDARNSVAYLLAAVAGDYAPPRSFLPSSVLPAAGEDGADK